MKTLIRWGKSPYETPEMLANEAEKVVSLGLKVVHLPQDADVSEITGADVLLVTSMQKVGAQELDIANKCKLLLTTTSGYDHLDLHAAKSRGIAVARMPFARRDAVVQTSLAMILGLLRDLPRLKMEANKGLWTRAQLPERQISRITDDPIGIIGLGVIGQKMSQILYSLGVEVLGYDPNVSGIKGVKNVSLEELIRRSRVITMHCLLEPGSPPIITRSNLGFARQDLILVNTARGKVLDLDAAFEALKEGRIGGLGLDVFPKEPYPDLAELNHDRILLSPHSAGYHDKLGEAVAEELMLAIRAFLEGEEIPNRLI